MYNTLVNSQKIFNLFANLYMRWQDEKEYEDFNEYAKVMACNVKNVIGDITDVKGTTHPFGIKFTHNDKKLHLTLNVQNEYANLKIAPAK